MNRRLVLVLVTAGLLGAGLVGSASASGTARDHKVCVNFGSDGILPPDYCLAWNDPLAPAS